MQAPFFNFTFFNSFVFLNEKDALINETVAQAQHF